MAHLTRIKAKLAIHAHRKVSGVLDGQYASTLSGRSLDFADLREYVVGDDVKDLDWKATARHGKPLVKRYVADRKHTVVLAFTTGNAMAAHANPKERKVDVAIMAAGLIGYLATRHGDYVGLYATNGHQTEAMRPSTREIEVERMLTKVEELCQLDAPEGELERLLEFAIGATRKRNIMVLVTDDADFSARAEGLLRRLIVQHELLLVTVADLNPAEVALTDDPVVQLESGRFLPDFVKADEQLAAEILEEKQQRLRRREQLCTKLGVPHELVVSTDDVIQTVFRLLEKSKHVAHR